MATAISSLQPLLDALKGHTAQLGKFVGGVASAKLAAEKKDNAAYMAALSRIQIGAVEMAQEMKALGWAWASRYRLDVWIRVYTALEKYTQNPTDALAKVEGCDPQATSCPPVGYAIAQLWADLAVEVIRGEWDEAKKRRAMKEAELAMFALGPAGIVVALYKLDEPFGLGIAEALGLDALSAKADELFDDAQEKADGYWRTVKIAAGVTAGIAGLFGVGYLIRSLRGND